MSDEKPNTIRCGTHATRPVAVVCGHVLGDTDRVLGFVENSSDPTDLQGWCGDCEAMFVSEGAMTDAFLEYNAMKVVCDLCYARLKARHEAIDR
jgi:hypothetical protein